MNKLWIGVVAIVILVAGAFVVMSGDDTEDVAQSTANSSQQSQTQSQPTTETPSTGVERYVPYSEAALADTSDTKRVLFFHATWCSTCNAFEREIEAQGVPEGITIVKANFDSDTDLKREYGVTVQSTFVLLDDQDQSVMSWPFGQGLSGISDLYEQVQSS